MHTIKSQRNIIHSYPVDCSNLRTATVPHVNPPACKSHGLATLKICTSPTGVGNSCDDFAGSISCHDTDISRPLRGVRVLRLFSLSACVSFSSRQRTILIHHHP
ncbi:unnamed protein product [Periconia digitata]|uniref:Uncharacterized protein n=1 Tax=Periconia digitata TaxID=1303443 RepID=A0A9W4UI80_9PLEO|nr:unnamed protein product [Periconia digitata]